MNHCFKVSCSVLLLLCALTLSSSGCSRTEDPNKERKHYTPPPKPKRPKLPRYTRPEPPEDREDRAVRVVITGPPPPPQIPDPDKDPEAAALNHHMYIEALSSVAAYRKATDLKVKKFLRIKAITILKEAQSIFDLADVTGQPFEKFERKEIERILTHIQDEK